MTIYQKQLAQDEILSAMAIAFDRVDRDSTIADADKTSLKNEMSKQMGRVEKLFGYPQGAFIRGC